MPGPMLCLHKDTSFNPHGNPNSNKMLGDVVRSHPRKSSKDSKSTTPQVGCLPHGIIISTVY